MLVAAFAPLGGAIAALGGLQTSATEPLLLSVLAGWLLRRTLRRESWDVVAVSLAGSLALIVLASLAVQCALAFQIAAPSGLTFPRALLQWLTRTSDVLGPQRPEVPAALRLLEGCGLFAMAVEVCRREPSVAVCIAAVVDTQCGRGRSPEHQPLRRSRASTGHRLLERRAARPPVPARQLDDSRCQRRGRAVRAGPAGGGRGSAWPATGADGCGAPWRWRSLPACGCRDRARP